MDPLSCDTLTMRHSFGCFHHPHQELFDHLVREVSIPEFINMTNGKITLLCKHCELICWYGFLQSFHRLQIQLARLCKGRCPAAWKCGIIFPHTVEVQLPVPCSFSTKEMLHQGHLLDILHPQFPSSALTHSLGKEL